MQAIEFGVAARNSRLRDSLRRLIQKTVNMLVLGTSQCLRQEGDMRGVPRYHRGNIRSGVLVPKIRLLASCGIRVQRLKSPAFDLQDHHVVQDDWSSVCVLGFWRYGTGNSAGRVMLAARAEALRLQSRVAVFSSNDPCDAR